MSADVGLFVPVLETGMHGELWAVTKQKYAQEGLDLHEVVGTGITLDECYLRPLMQACLSDYELIGIVDCDDEVDVGVFSLATELLRQHTNAAGVRFAEQPLRNWRRWSLTDQINDMMHVHRAVVWRRTAAIAALQALQAQRFGMYDRYAYQCVMAAQGGLIDLPMHGYHVNEHDAQVSKRYCRENDAAERSRQFGAARLAVLAALA
jgi:hypothetical protein